MRLTAAQARRVAVAAQGFAEPRPPGPVTRAHLKRLIARIQVLQLDSVSVSVRAHYAPVFSRLGPYDRDLLDRAAWSHSARSPRLLVEYWAHEAALMAVDDWPLLRWRMREYAHGRWGTEIVKRNAKLADDIVAAVAELGPSTAGQIEAHLESEPRGRKGPWWDRSDTKWVAEALWSAGVLTTATRVGFARHYDLTERVLPADVVARAGRRGGGRPRAHAAGRHCARRRPPRPTCGTTSGSAARQVKPAIAELVAAGELEPVRGRRLDRARVPARRPDRAAPRPGHRAAVPVRPVDLLPAPRRAALRLPLPHRDLHPGAEAAVRLLRVAVPDRRPAGRARRPQGRPRRPARCRWSARSPRPGEDPSPIAEPLAAELRSMAGWLGLDDVTVGDREILRGGLASALLR